GYATNGMPDYGADQMYQACKKAGTLSVDYGTMSAMPEIPGLLLRPRPRKRAGTLGFLGKITIFVS
uniref:hypothetical protein n=1 Tax=Alistipes sp. TaxID=1872444 RepID=UPI003AB9182E